MMKIHEKRGNAMFFGDKVKILPEKPMIVAIIVFKPTFSFKKTLESIKVNIGIVKLVNVTVDIGTNRMP